jgi:hypothetical protein
MNFAMRKLLALSLLLLCPALVTASGTFLAGIEDVPVPPGFTENQSAGMTFDSPSGRIIIAVANGTDLTREQVLAFYVETLPQLGWTRISDTEFRSDSETLRITIDKGTQQQLTVHYNLTPNS